MNNTRYKLYRLIHSLTEKEQNTIGKNLTKSGKKTKDLELFKLIIKKNISNDKELMNVSDFKNLNVYKNMLYNKILELLVFSNQHNETLTNYTKSIAKIYQLIEKNLLSDALIFTNKLLKSENSKIENRYLKASVLHLKTYLLRTLSARNETIAGKNEVADTFFLLDELIEEQNFKREHDFIEYELMRLVNNKTITNHIEKLSIKIRKVLQNHNNFFQIPAEKLNFEQIILRCILYNKACHIAQINNTISPNFESVYQHIKQQKLQHHNKRLYSFFLVNYIHYDLLPNHKIEQFYKLYEVLKENNRLLTNGNPPFIVEKGVVA